MDIALRCLPASRARSTSRAGRRAPRRRRPRRERVAPRPRGCGRIRPLS